MQKQKSMFTYLVKKTGEKAEIPEKRSNIKESGDIRDKVDAELVEAELSCPPKKNSNVVLKPLGRKTLHG